MLRWSLDQLISQLRRKKRKRNASAKESISILTGRSQICSVYSKNHKTFAGWSRIWYRSRTIRKQSVPGGVHDSTLRPFNVHSKPLRIGSKLTKNYVVWNRRYLYGQWTDFDDERTKRKSFSCTTQVYEKIQHHTVLSYRKGGLDWFHKIRKSENIKINDF